MIYFYTCLGPNCKDYTELLHRSCEATKSGMVDIAYFAVESVGCDGHPKGWNVIGKSEDAGHCSKNHAAAIDLCIEHYQQMAPSQGLYDSDTDVFVLCDADMAILFASWDMLVSAVFNKSKNRSSNTSLTFGVSNGDSPHRYINYPSVYFFSTIKPEFGAFSPVVYDRFDSCQRVYTENLKYIGNKVYKECYFPKGPTIKCDTGWELPMHGNVRTGGALPRIWSNDPKAKLPFKDDAMRKRCFEKKEHQCEWHYNGQLFASHKQACRSHSLNGSQEGMDWKWRVLEYAKRKGIEL